MKTPKEKAIELVDKFINIEIEYYDSIEGYCFMTMAKLYAKECALIAVDEIIKYSPNKPDYEFDPIEYFNKVKQEIEKL